MDRVAVFFDYQNVSGWAKRCFGAGDGHVWPKATAELLVSRRLRDSSLVETRVYRGRPNPTRQVVSARANDRQTAGWEATGVSVVRRNLQYPPQWPSAPASEKGIDVALAVDLVKYAIRGDIDAAIVFSSDRTSSQPSSSSTGRPAVTSNSPAGAEAAAFGLTIHRSLGVISSIRATSSASRT